MASAIETEWRVLKMPDMFGLRVSGRREVTVVHRAGRFELRKYGQYSEGQAWRGGGYSPAFYVIVDRSTGRPVTNRPVFGAKWKSGAAAGIALADKLATEST
jgi:hypothetical protein